MSRNGERDKRRTAILLGCLLLIVLGYPYLDATRIDSDVFYGILVVTSIGALYAAAAERRMVRVGTALTVPMIIGMWWPLESAAPLRHVGLVCEAALFFLVAFAIGRQVLRNEEVTEDTLSGAACVYLFLGLAWTALYLLIEERHPGSFTFKATQTRPAEMIWPDLLYFSFTTLTTTGYGDICPLSDQARSVALLEHMIGVLYIAIVVARLVALYRAPARNG